MLKLYLLKMYSRILKTNFSDIFILNDQQSQCSHRRKSQAGSKKLMINNGKVLLLIPVTAFVHCGFVVRKAR